MYLKNRTSIDEGYVLLHALGMLCLFSYFLHVISVHEDVPDLRWTVNHLEHVLLSARVQSLVHHKKVEVCLKRYDVTVCDDFGCHVFVRLLRWDVDVQGCWVFDPDLAMVSVHMSHKILLKDAYVLYINGLGHLRLQKQSGLL